jgi:tetratricopeptide (TPR) repeat protein
MDLKPYWPVVLTMAGPLALVAVLARDGWPVARTVVAPDCATVLAESSPGDPRHAFAAGLCLEARGRLDDATSMFLAAAAGLGDSGDRAAALHNAGTVLARRGRDAEALDAWRGALRLGDREATRRNYEIVAARVRRKTPPRLRAEGVAAERLIEKARDLERPRRRDAGAASGGW